MAMITGLALAAAASAPGSAAPKKGEAGYDPERQICRSKAVIGSRLKRVRECHSAAEWADMKMQEQVGLMRKQTNGSAGCQGCGAGRDSPW
ncbi:MAG TPA: hypothetical protein VF759_11385 [Allosphingosinicella sp.]